MEEKQTTHGNVGIFDFLRCPPCGRDKHTGDMEGTLWESTPFNTTIVPSPPT
jgi:hypothetical protein